MKLFMKRYGLLRDAEQEDGMGALNDVNVSEMGLLEFHEYCKSVNVSEMDAHEFAMYCKRWTERWNNPQTEAERLVYEMTHNNKGRTNQEWLDLQKEVREFLKTATEEDRKLIGGYTESLCMICSAIKEGLL